MNLCSEKIINPRVTGKLYETKHRVRKAEKSILFFDGNIAATIHDFTLAQSDRRNRGYYSISDKSGQN